MWIAELFFDLAVFALTLYEVRRYMGARLSSILSTIIRDGTVYFVVRCRHSTRI
ncbi:hypothetical protein CPB84DRAFT_1785847 [Gymnopilus junonius]|uniref:Uncharacterized protein n=1 Tax=Gymnopilus junonius TaxID=109634 RepID=A0A9P5TL01_GYMJU|nr:hypothetical protein CPB84DRAFT_1785847 [Gymnopilus junonius]